MESIYYSPGGYWKGYAAINKLANAAAVKYKTAKDWLSKQAIWQIYLPRPKKINYSHFDVFVPNEVHQADILFLPHDNGYKYALTVVDIASRYKQAIPLKTKSSTEVSTAFKKKYVPGRNSPNFHTSVRTAGSSTNFNEPILGDVTVRYLYEPGELEGGSARATDPIWSVTTHKISSLTRSSTRPAIYRLDSSAPQRGFTREQLQVIPDDTQLPPKNIS